MSEPNDIDPQLRATLLAGVDRAYAGADEAITELVEQTRVILAEYPVTAAWALMTRTIEQELGADDRQKDGWLAAALVRLALPHD